MCVDFLEMRPGEVLDIARRAGGISSATELIEGGARWEDLYRLRDSGELIELSRGVYRVADAPATAHRDLGAGCRRAPEHRRRGRRRATARSARRYPVAD